MSKPKTTNAIVLEDGRVLVEQADGSFRAEKDQSNWSRVHAMTEEDIKSAAENDPDAPPADEGYWTDPSVIVIPEKKSVTAKFDSDVIEWFQRQGRGYQTRMNAVLRTYMEANRGR